jgi:sugar phosphate permease
MSDSAPTQRPTNVRHAVLWMTVLAYLITYMDRGVISVAAPFIQEEFGFSLITMGWILGMFQWGYAMFQIPGGWLGDRYGTRRVLSGIVIWWSAFTALTALTWSASSMAICRFLFGMGEAGAFPNATRSLSRWILPAERGFAQGLTHAGARLGGALTPLVVVWLISLYGWRVPFFLFAGVGIAWAVAWFLFYRDTPGEHRSVNQAERDLIEAGLGKAEGKSKVSPPWGKILRNPQMWILTGMYACYAFDFGIVLAWFPKYLTAEQGFSMKQMGVYASLPLLAGVLGGVCGGTISDFAIKRTGNIKLARRIVAIGGFSLAAIMIPLSVMAPDPVIGVLLFCAAVFGLEITVGVSWAVTLDVGGEYAGSVSAVMNTGGNLAGAFGATLTGYLVTAYGWDALFYVLAGLAALAAFMFLRIDASRPLAPPAKASAG